MFEKIKAFFSKLFFMSEEEYINSIEYYSQKFDLHWEWKFFVTEELPNVNMNYERSKALACTDFDNRQVNFKTMIFKKNPKFMAKAYIRHELRHCQQMEILHDKLREKYGELSGIYTTMLIGLDNSRGYGKSIMEQDAWMTFFGFHYNINKVVNRIIKRNMRFVTQEC